MDLVHARARRRFRRGLKMKPLALMTKLRKAKKEAAPLEKPAVVKTHLRNMIILPDMIGSIVGVHNGKTFNQVEIKVSKQCYGICKYLCDSGESALAHDFRSFQIGKLHYVVRNF